MAKAVLAWILTFAAALGAAGVAAQSGHDLFQQALVKERAEGNLQEAIDLYERIVRTFPGDHALAARALVQMGQCYEKLGKAEARKAYERVIRDYADQTEPLQVARTRLAALTGPPHREMTVRRVWSDPMADFGGEISPDGRYLSFVDWTTGDLAVRDLTTGQNRRLTNKGSWEVSQEYAVYSCWSPDGKQIAYDWWSRAIRTSCGSWRSRMRTRERSTRRPRRPSSRRWSGLPAVARYSWLFPAEWISSSAPRPPISRRWRWPTEPPGSSDPGTTSTRTAPGCRRTDASSCPPFQPPSAAHRGMCMPCPGMGAARRHSWFTRPTTSPRVGALTGSGSCSSAIGPGPSTFGCFRWKTRSRPERRAS